MQVRQADVICHWAMRKKLADSLDRLKQIIPDSAIILPGHGEHSEMGLEKINNPFLREVYNEEQSGILAQNSCDSFIVTLIILVPQILYPFSISLILSVLLTPVADSIQALMRKAGLQKFPYDISIILSFLLFIALVYLVIIHILVPFVTEAKSFINGLPAIVQEIQQAIPALEANMMCV